MKCPHLLRWTVSSCKADAKPYVPSIFELDQYCTVRAYKNCPLYRVANPGYEDLARVAGGPQKTGTL